MCVVGREALPSYFDEKAIAWWTGQLVFGYETTFEWADDCGFEDANGGRERDRLIAATHLNVSGQRQKYSIERTTRDIRDESE